MFMSFEKIETPIEAKPEVEHPAYRAAAMVKSLHEETIKRIDGGLVFLKDGVDVSAEMRTKCEEEIVVCDDLMRRAKKMDPSLWAPSFEVLREAEEAVADRSAELAAIDKPASVDEQDTLPEIGNYGHDETH